MSAADGAAPLLEVTDVRAGYGRVPVLHGVSLSVRPGSITAVLGPNGAGKTTLLRAISGLIPITAGTIAFGERDLCGRQAHERARLGITHIPEGRGIYRRLTVRENLLMQAVPGREKEAFAAAADAFPVLAERLEQPAGTLSGGEQQMLAMVAAYVRAPRLLLVDEPSFGLAPLVTEMIFEFLARVASEGVALVIVDQFVDHVLALADTAYVLRHGEVAFSGPAGELDAAAIHAHYLGSAPASEASAR